MVDKGLSRFIWPDDHDRRHRYSLCTVPGSLRSIVTRVLIRFQEEVAAQTVRAAVTPLPSVPEGQ